MTFTFSPVDGGADTLLTVSGESVALGSSDTLRDNTLPFDFLSDSFVLQPTGPITIYGSVSGNLNLYGLFGDHNGGAGVDQFALLLGTPFQTNETITGSGSARVGLAYDQFLSGGLASEGYMVPFVIALSVPDTGSTAALLGVGVAALAFARRRLFVILVWRLVFL